MRAGLWIALAVLMFAPACAKKTAAACEIPATLPHVMLEGPTVDQPRRLLPIGGYTLAVSWSPQHCVNLSTSPQNQIECGGTNAFGFTLHGLWPDGEGAQWPQYCTPTRLVPEPVIREHLCSTPSPQLIQHEWEKHGTCMSKRPSDYFAKSGAMFSALRFPDMSKLSGHTMTAMAFQQTFAEANEGMKADQIRLLISKAGWLEEVWICHDKAFQRQSCPAHQGGALPDQIIRVR